MNIDNDYPWKMSWFFRKGFTTEPVKQDKNLLTVKMFAESVKAGRWLNGEMIYPFNEIRVQRVPVREGAANKR
ncbi:DUF1493 family protein [Pantoea stewartii]|uniref:DUF1493 family protein n=1 Tax=Pantoea stewartii TaxID=66269 RepID=UPI00345B7347